MTEQQKSGDGWKIWIVLVVFNLAFSLVSQTAPKSWSHPLHPRVGGSIQGWHLTFCLSSPFYSMVMTAVSCDSTCVLCYPLAQKSTTALLLHPGPSSASDCPSRACLSELCHSLLPSQAPHPHLTDPFTVPEPQHLHSHVRVHGTPVARKSTIPFPPPSASPAEFLRLSTGSPFFVGSHLDSHVVS